VLSIVPTRQGCLTPRILSALLAAAGLVDLGSALTPALTWRLNLIQELIGERAVHISQTATVLAGLCALMLARSLARRNRRAMQLAIFALLASSVLNLLKGLDVEEAGICLGVAALLWRARDDFSVGALPVPLRAAVARMLWLAALSVLYAEAGALLLGRQVEVLVTLGRSHHPLPFPVAAFLGLWTDAPMVRYAGPQGHWFQHSLYALAAACVVYAVVRLLRPLIPVAPASPEERARARALVWSYGCDALDYFHLRPDRAYLFAPSGEGFISYAVRGDVALLGGDPVCPPGSTMALIRHALEVFEANGLTPCVVGASTAAMRAYRQAGMRAVKIGEEAVIDLMRFDRQALAKRVRRAARAIAAQHIRIHIGTMADMDPSLTAQCADVSQAWLRGHGGMPQGFSMTSGPLPDGRGRDHRVVLGALPDEAGGPGQLLGLLTLAPVPAGQGWSLDHMRRLPDAPNGLMEALIIAAAERARDEGCVMLSLNFAALSDRECPEGEGAPIRAARAALFEGARHLQLCSLYRFNKKFQPQWSCRYWLYRSADRLPASAYATVRAEVSAPALLPGPLGAALRPR
jgi:lysyl-tRNA synthetase class 2